MAQTVTDKPEHPINTADWWKVYGVGGENVKPGHVSVDELTSYIRDGTTIPGKDFVVVDVRRSDCESIIPTAINLPSHSFPATLPSLLPFLSTVPKIVFHCNSSKGRGTKTAGWLADALAKHYAAQGFPSDQVESQVQGQVLILTGGIVAWIEKHGQGSTQDRGKPWDGKSLAAVHL